MPDKKAQNKKIFLFLRLAFVIIGLTAGSYILFKDEGWTDFIQKLSEINTLKFILLLFLALVIFITGQVVVAFRWWILLRTQKVFITFWTAVRLNFLGLFYNNCMPGAVGGDLVRAWYVAKHTHRRFEAALSVFVDRIIGLVSTLVIAVTFFIIFLRDFRALPSKETTAGNAEMARGSNDYYQIFIWLGIAIVIFISGLLLSRRSRSVMIKIWGAFLELVRRFGRRLVSAFFVYCKNPGAILMVFALTVCLQLAQITGFWLVGRELGIELDLKYYYTFFTITWVIGAIPVSLGGLVVVEGLLISLFMSYGTDKASATVIALCQRIVWMLASLPGGVVHLLGGHLPREFLVDGDNTVN